MKQISSRKNEEQFIVNAYLDKYNCDEIANFLNRNRYTIYRVLKKNNIKKRVKRKKGGKLTFEQRTEEIPLLYKSGLSTVKIGKMYGITASNVWSFLKRGNIEIRDISHANQRYAINENYFENIDVGEKAYWLGFILGDGAILKCKDYHGIGYLRILIKDKEHLEKFKNCIQSGHPIKINNQDLYQISISNKKMVIDLSRYGIVPNKVFNTKFPNINKKFYHHFIRGLFDADGCVSIGGTGYIFTITGTRELLEYIQNILMDKCILRKTKFSHKLINKNTFGLRYGGNIQIKRIFNYLYKDSTVHLDRKYKKFKGVFN